MPLLNNKKPTYGELNTLLTGMKGHISSLGNSTEWDIDLPDYDSSQETTVKQELTQARKRITELEILNKELERNAETLKKDLENKKCSHQPTDLKPNDYDQLKNDLSKWTTKFLSLTPEQVHQKYNEPKGRVISQQEQYKLDNFDVLKKERDDLLAKSTKKPISQESSLSKKISDEINKAYRAPRYLFGYYLKLIKSFQDWEIFGNDEQKLASSQNKTELVKVSQFLNSFNLN